MAFTDIKEAFINIDDDFSTDEKKTILDVLELAYDKSSTFDLVNQIHVPQLSNHF